MERNLARRNAAIVAAAFIAAFAAVLALGQPRPSGPPPLPVLSVEPESSDPLDLFTVMMPVFTHPRCANCHGAVDPHAESGPLANTHDGGIIPQGGTCAGAGCHTDDILERSPWKTALPSHNFNGRTAKQLCDMQSGVADDLNARTSDGYFHHLHTDFLIDLAFIGLSGGASSTEAAPPMSKEEFLKAGRAWLKLGARCDHWKGSITQHETFASSYSYVQGGGGRVTVTQNAERILTVDRADGVSTYRINQGGNQHLVMVMQPVGPSGSCEITTTSNGRWSGLNQGAAPGNVSIFIRPDGTYTIRLAGPKEKTVSRDSGRQTTTCPMEPMGPSSDTTVLDWPRWKTTIHCPPTFQQNPQGGNSVDCDLYDPRTNPRLKGTMTRTIRGSEDAADPASWLVVSPVGISRSDTGAQIPVKVVTTWDLMLPP